MKTLIKNRVTLAQCGGMWLAKEAFVKSRRLRSVGLHHVLTIPTCLNRLSAA